MIRTAFLAIMVVEATTFAATNAHTSCNFQGSFAYEPNLIPHELFEIMLHDKNIVQPDGCNRCPTVDSKAVWIAPGDLCALASLYADNI